ncbi:glycosyltransferase family 4 protein [Fibrella forsythiae]|uniref:Glycosyltransferase family 4 protein n=1 Tax=Fibrella forsythiae TaxID=2817061 RepID=A0ABS3JPU9_9BACT|nr:glycosyltransferase family 1 protein [Fibrella forsythiae]MBO0952026.1 glycosyltransferase family 4 protein [Fibrella forsythiae]
MPKLFVDTQPLKHINTGMGQVCLNLSKELIRQCPANWEITFLVPKGKEGFFGPSVQYKVATEWLRHWRTTGYDVWHCLHQGSKFLPAQSTSLVYTILDLNYLIHPSYTDKQKAKQKKRYQARVDQASVVTTISEYVANDVRQQLTLPPATPVEVTYLGANVPDNIQSLSPSFRPDGPFLLFMGVVDPRKNVHTLLPILAASPAYKLVLAGDMKPDYVADLLASARQMGVADRLILPGSVDEATKWWLYAHCDAFLFPSLLEGFGLPVVEAMALGKPVFSSDKMSLPEVGGPDAFYFRSFEPQAMIDTFQAGMATYANDPAYPDRLRAFSQQFRWENVAATYWRIYTGLV